MLEKQKRVKVVISYKPTIYNLGHNSSKYSTATHLLTQHILFKQRAMHMFDTNGRKETMNLLRFGITKYIWERSMSNELGKTCLGQQI